MTRHHDQLDHPDYSEREFENDLREHQDRIDYDEAEKRAACEELADLCRIDPTEAELIEEYSRYQLELERQRAKPAPSFVETLAEVQRQAAQRRAV